MSDPRRRTKEMLLYELLGIRAFKILWELWMRGTTWIFRQDKTKIKFLRRDADENYPYAMFSYMAFIIHFFSFAGIAVITPFMGPWFWPMFALNILMNVYPCMLQRYNWLRLKRAKLNPDLSIS